MEKVEIDFTIIGGGIVGILTGLEIQNKFPESIVAIIEKEIHLGEHTSSRNSGVLHSGLYYETNSLKHKLCIEGYDLWLKLTEELNIPHKLTGKVIFAQDEAELQNLNGLKQQARKNNVLTRDLTPIEEEKLSEFIFFKKAFCVPKTGIIDTATAIKKTQLLFERKGGLILKGDGVKNLSLLENGFYVQFNDGEKNFTSRYLVNCAGLGSIQIRRMLGLNNLDTYFVKGSYIKTNERFEIDQLIYPVPPADGKGLGIHLTIDLEGTIKFGPNTEVVEKVDYIPSASEEEKIKSYVESHYKKIDIRKLHFDMAGVRPKIILNNTLYKDFWIKGSEDHFIPNYVECCGIESPGFTAAPAIAKMIAGLIKI